MANLTLNGRYHLVVFGEQLSLRQPCSLNTLSRGLSYLVGVLHVITL